jgi:hypothetical protein
LVTSRLLLRAWAAGRLGSRGPVTGLLAVAAACALWVAAGLGYRVAEVPLVSDRFDMPSFIASLPTPQENEAGRLTRGACDRLQSLERELAHRTPTKPLFPGQQPQPGDSFRVQAWQVLERGWPPGDPELGDWLDKMFADVWPQRLAEAAGKPPGLVEDPRQSGAIQRFAVLNAALSAGALLPARGLQLQARGDDRAFVENLRAGLALSRNLRHRSDSVTAGQGRAVESHVLAGLDRWLERLDGRPDLLRQVLELLLGHEAELLPSFADQEKADYLVAMTTLEQPEGWLASILFDSLPPGKGKADEEQRRQLEAAAVAVAWRVPWEAERQRRILRAVVEGDPEQQLAARRMRPPILGNLDVRQHFNDPRRRQVQLCSLRAAQLKAALRLYQVEQGKPAENLRVLLAKGYLAQIPQDPFDGNPFRYRLSRGERIEWPKEGPVIGAPPPPGEAPAGAEVPIPPGGGAGPFKEVPAGQGILWSVGEDRVDDGGRRQISTGSGETARGEDRIFLVPLPPGRAGNKAP